MARIEHRHEVCWESVTSQLNFPLFAVLSPTQHGHWLSSAHQSRCLSLPTKPGENSLKMLVNAPGAVRLWQWLEGHGFTLEYGTKFGVRGIPGGSYESIKNVFAGCQTCLQRFHCTELWLREGTLGKQTQPQACGYDDRYYCPMSLTCSDLDLPILTGGGSWPPYPKPWQSPKAWPPQTTFVCSTDEKSPQLHAWTLTQLDLETHLHL